MDRGSIWIAARCRFRPPKIMRATKEKEETDSALRKSGRTIIVGSLQIRRPAGRGRRRRRRLRSRFYGAHCIHNYSDGGGGGVAERGTLLYDDVPSLPPRRLRRPSVLSVSPLSRWSSPTKHLTDRRAGGQGPLRKAHIHRPPRREEEEEMLP